MLVLDSELVEGGDEANLVPHRSRLGDLERSKGHGGLHRREGRVSMRRHVEDTWTPAVGALWSPWVVADPWTHGPVLTDLVVLAASSTLLVLVASSTTVWPAITWTVLALALAFPGATALVSAAIATDVGVVGATRVGPGGGGAAPTRASAARVSHSEEGGVDDCLLIIGRAKFLEN
jgi:hypothetical protein